jgi:glucosamine--fructose-6-phosphate aminotransferase (isomerizing)
MCGIVGYVGKRDATEVLIEGLRRLEYRGYDSAGVAVASGGKLGLCRSVGKISALEKALAASPLPGPTGVGHTRWATHGRPSEQNAHPHRDCSGDLVVVHNGIIENHRALREELLAAGHTLASETDSEVVAHLVESLYRGDLLAAVRAALPRIHGVYALCVLHSAHPDRVIATRNGPPLVVGLGEGETFIASDIPAVLHRTRDFVFLEDGDIAVVTAGGVGITGADGRPRKAEAQRITWDPILAEKGGFKHFMQKEIHEQPRALADTLRGRVLDGPGGSRVELDEVGLDPAFVSSIDRCVILACGTSWHAGLVGQFLVGSWRGSTSPSTTAPSSATATPSSGPAPSPSPSPSRGRPPTPWPPCASAAARGPGWSRCATWWGARSPASPTGWCRPTQAPRSGWPPPRRSPPSSPPSPCSPSGWGKNAATSPRPGPRNCSTAWWPSPR